ncbi:MAG: LPXTG cell wall anchor domain-containing protein, partial [Bacteroidota bacterium]
GKIDTANTNKGTVLKQLFRITSFDSGQWVIPSYILPQNSDLKTDSIIINVGFMPMDTTKDYNDIKEIIEVNVKKGQDWTWYYAGGGVLLLAIIIYLLTKKKKKKEQQIAQAAEKIIDPYTEALDELEKLQRENLIAKNETKQYYSRVTDIFRIYVEKKKNIQSLQQTTDDLVSQLRNINLGKEQYNQLSQALRLSDFVKFAKYIPTDADHKNVFDTIKNSIQVIEKMNVAPASAGSNQ